MKMVKQQCVMAIRLHLWSGAMKRVLGMQKKEQLVDSTTSNLGDNNGISGEEARTMYKLEVC